jgi:GGDEF domain-containing protein
VSVAGFTLALLLVTATASSAMADSGVGNAGRAASNLALLVSGILGLVALGLLRFDRRGEPSRPSVTTPGCPDKTRRGPAPDSRAPAPPPADRRGPASPVTEIAGRICVAFNDWLAVRHEPATLWTAFDQFIRELLLKHLEATRVRCFHVPPGAAALVPLGHSIKTAGGGPTVRDGILGHVTATGREYLVGQPAQPPLIRDLAARDVEPWQWIWPIRNAQATTGVIAIARANLGQLTPELRGMLGPLLTVLWNYVQCLERAGITAVTDGGSGLLTRAEFLVRGERELADAYHENEPVAAAVFALEGLRGLDDAGRWRERDRLIEELGHAVAERVRGGDLVGRFTDDRFAVLLRRLDGGLGRLIAEKLLTEAQTCLERLGLQHAVRLRVGLAGSGLARPELLDLLAAAQRAVDRARQEGLRVLSDVDLERAT